MWLYLNNRGGVATTQFTWGLKSPTLEIDEERMRAIFQKAGSAGLNDIMFIEAMEGNMVKAERADWLVIWIDEEGQVKRTKKRPDEGDYDEAYLVMNVPPFIHTSGDGVVKQFLMPKKAVGQKNGGPETEQRVKWHEEKQKVLRKALKRPSPLENRALRLIGQEGPIKSLDFCSRMGMSTEHGGQLVRELLDAGKIAHNDGGGLILPQQGQTEGYIEVIKGRRKEQGQQTLKFDVANLFVDVDKLFADVDSKTDVDSLFD